MQAWEELRKKGNKKWEGEKERASEMRGQTPALAEVAPSAAYL